MKNNQTTSDKKRCGSCDFYAQDTTCLLDDSRHGENEDSCDDFVAKKIETTSEEIREAFEKEYLSGNYCEYMDGKYRFKDITFISQDTRVMLNNQNAILRIFKSGYTSHQQKANAEIEELKGKIDDIVLQENQSLKEQIKILAHITYTYNPDVDISKYINSLAAQDYQLFLDDNKIEEGYKSRIKELEQQIENSNKKSCNNCKRTLCMDRSENILCKQWKNSFSIA